MSRSAWDQGYQDTFNKFAVDDPNTPMQEKKILPWWTPLATAGALGLGTYALARHPFEGPAGSALARIREAAKGDMLYGTKYVTDPKGLSLETGKPLTLWEKILLPFKEGPVIDTEKKNWAKALKEKEGPHAVWDWDSPGVKGVTFNPAMGPPGPKTQAWGSRQAAKLEDRLLEYNLLTRHAPGTQARTLDIADVLKRHRLPLRERYMVSDLRRLQKALEKEFPTGYLAKTRGEGTIDVNVNSTGNFPMFSHDWGKEWKLWKKLRPQYLKDLEKETYDLSNVAYEYRDRPGYTGRVLEEMLNRNAVLQSYKDLAGEYRVHVMGGKAIPYLTHPRYPSSTPIGTAMDFAKGHRTAKWLQKEVLDKLPAKYRNMSFAADVAPLEGGGHTVIELNTGGASGYLDYPYVPNLLHKAVTGRFTRPVAGALAAGAGTLGAGAGLGAYALSPKRMVAVPPEVPVPVMSEEENPPIPLAGFR